MPNPDQATLYAMIATTAYSAICTVPTVFQKGTRIGQKDGRRKDVFVFLVCPTVHTYLTQSSYQQQPTTSTPRACVRGMELDRNSPWRPPWRNNRTCGMFGKVPLKSSFSPQLFPTVKCNWFIRRPGVPWKSTSLALEASVDSH